MDLKLSRSNLYKEIGIFYLDFELAERVRLLGRW
jgi:hypothetical protein